MPNPESITDIPALYTALLDGYREDCRQKELRIMDEARHNYFRTVAKMRRNLIHGARPDDPDWHKLPDLFGELVIRRRGTPTLARLASCSPETLATLAAWNTINEAGWERRFIVRRTIAGAFTLFTAFGTILKTFNGSISAHDTLHWLLTHDVVGNYLLGLCVVFLFLAIFEAIPLRKLQNHILHFGQLLSIAIAFQSKHAASSAPEIPPIDGTSRTL